MDLSIIIVNWRTKDYVKQCIQSIVRETEDVEYEIVVVDNASFDGCDDMLKREFPLVKCVQAASNLGFAAANNLGVHEARSGTLLFLNPDTVILDRAIATLFTRLHSLPNPGAVGARLLNTDLSFQTSCIKSYPTILNQVLSSDALQRRFPMWKIWGMADGFRSSSEPAEVEVVSGACIMMKRQVFEKIGGFNDTYFMYSEDVDLCLMCGRAGLRNYYIPEAIIVHHGGSGSSRADSSDFSTLMFMESRYHYFARTRGIVYAAAYRLCVVIAGGARLAMIAVALVFQSKPSVRAHFFGSRKKWLSIVAWSLGWKRARHPL